MMAGPLPAVTLTFRAVEEARPGPRWKALFDEMWPSYHEWYLRDGEAKRPRFREAKQMLETHMPELVPVWSELVELAGGGDLAARCLAMYDTPPLVAGCSQAIHGEGGSAILVRNYDFHPGRFEALVLATSLTGRRVVGTSDCLWGLLDGLNDAGLAVSLTFGGDRLTDRAFAIPLVVRYLLETCETVPDATRALKRLPVQAAYNLTLLDGAGRHATLFVGPGRPPEESPFAVATNHQASVSWTQHARATRTVERQEVLTTLLADPAVDREAFVTAFLQPPLRSTNYAGGFGTLYTAVYSPRDGMVEYRWPALTWAQWLDRFEEGRRDVVLPATTAM